MKTKHLLITRSLLTAVSVLTISVSLLACEEKSVTPVYGPINVQPSIDIDTTHGVPYYPIDQPVRAKPVIVVSDKNEI